MELHSMRLWPFCTSAPRQHQKEISFVDQSMFRVILMMYIAKLRRT